MQFQIFPSMVLFDSSALLKRFESCVGMRMPNDNGEGTPRLDIINSVEDHLGLFRT